MSSVAVRRCGCSPPPPPVPPLPSFPPQHQDVLADSAAWRDAADGGAAFHHLNAAAGAGFTALKATFERCAALGVVLVVSELNLLPSEVLEGVLLPHMASPRTHRCFFVVGTINDNSHSGRAALPPRLQNLFNVLQVFAVTLLHLRR